DPPPASLTLPRLKPVRFLVPWGAPPSVVSPRCALRPLRRHLECPSPQAGSPPRPLIRGGRVVSGSSSPPSLVLARAGSTIHTCSYRAQPDQCYLVVA